MLSPSPPWLVGSQRSHLTAATCSSIESNSTLAQGIVYLYDGNGNASGPGSGLINQSPPGPSAYPPESTAVTNVVTGWTSICTSSSFFTLEQRWGARNASWSGLARNSTGIYEFVVTIGWQAAATQCTPFHSECLGSAEWLINVASGAWSGPTTTYVSPGVAGNQSAEFLPQTGPPNPSTIDGGHVTVVARGTRMTAGFARPSRPD